MQTDGQMYSDKLSGPPPAGCAEHTVRHTASIGRDELLILGLIFLLSTDKKKTDMPLILALVYILF